MAFSKLSKVTYQKQSRNASRSSSTYRYKRCEIIKDGDIDRLTFIRHSNFYVPTPDYVEYILPPGRESRLDIVANEQYNTPRLYWAIAIFNRWLSINPLRFFTNALLRLPKLNFITSRVG